MPGGVTYTPVAGAAGSAFSAAVGPTTVVSTAELLAARDAPVAASTAAAFILSRLAWLGDGYGPSAGAPKTRTAVAERSSAPFGFSLSPVTFQSLGVLISAELCVARSPPAGRPAG